jgi:hypothetical protein
MGQISGGEPRMNVLRKIACLCAFLLLCGCVVSQNEPFSLDDGERVALSGDYICIGYDDEGKPAEPHELMLILIERNNKSQYALADRKDLKSPPFTLFPLKEGLYVAAVASPQGPGEGFFAVQFKDPKLSLYYYYEKTDDRMQSLASKHGVSATRDGPVWSISGVLANQRALILDLASDLTGWHKSADCTKQN